MTVAANHIGSSTISYVKKERNNCVPYGRIEETPENIERDPDTPQPAGEQDIQIKYCGWLCSSNVGSATKTYL